MKYESKVCSYPEVSLSGQHMALHIYASLLRYMVVHSYVIPA